MLILRTIDTTFDVASRTITHDASLFAVWRWRHRIYRFDEVLGLKLEEDTDSKEYRLVLKFTGNRRASLNYHTEPLSAYSRILDELSSVTGFPILPNEEE